MKRVVANIPAIFFLSAGVFLILHGHSIAGGWLCIAGFAVTHVDKSS